MTTRARKPVKRRVSMRTDVVLFGEVLWDFFEVAPGTFTRAIGGASANAAVALARSGLTTALVGALGSDAMGDALVAALAAEGVDTGGIARLRARTGIVFVTRSKTGEPTFANYRAASADRLITRAHVLSATPSAAWAVVSSSAAAPAAVFARRARTLGAAFAVDVNARPHLAPSRRALQDAVAEMVEHADLVKASSSDLDALVSPARAGDEAAALRWLAARAPGATILITRGGGPATCTGAHGRVERPAIAPRARVLDATGAGDAFLAGVLSVLVRGGAKPGTAAWSDAGIWTQALEVGHTLGKQAVSRVGAVARREH
ncbi:MAG: 2-dehydro-3-deoxygluconate kinase [Myxococcaceae bacterium]|nr:2-dehydro-3-deoxygluconate kinase [Myxococcaceae bacterium]